MNLKNIMGVFLFAGTLVGAGILGLPFALSKSGFIGGTILLMSGAFFAYLTAIYIGLLVYEQGLNISLDNIIQKHLGKTIAYISLASIIFSAYGALVAYPLAIGETLNSLLHIPAWMGSFGFIIFISVLLSQDLGNSTKFNAIITLFLVSLLVWVMYKSAPLLEPRNLLYFNPAEVPGAWGIVIFAFSGHLVIPSVLYFTSTEIRKGLAVLGWGIISVTSLYFIFFLISIGVMGNEVTQVATLGLATKVGPLIGTFGQVFAISAIITSSFGMGISLKRTYESKFSLVSWQSLILVILPVVIINLYLSASGGEAFIQVLNFSGIGSAIYAGIIPAWIMLNLSRTSSIPHGKKLAYLSLAFYSLAILFILKG